MISSDLVVYKNVDKHETCIYSFHRIKSTSCHSFYFLNTSDGFLTCLEYHHFHLKMFLSGPWMVLGWLIHRLKLCTVLIVFWELLVSIEACFVEKDKYFVSQILNVSLGEVYFYFYFSTFTTVTPCARVWPNDYLL